MAKNIIQPWEFVLWKCDMWIVCALVYLVSPQFFTFFASFFLPFSRLHITRHSLTSLRYLECCFVVTLKNLNFQICRRSHVGDHYTPHIQKLRSRMAPEREKNPMRMLSTSQVCFVPSIGIIPYYLMNISIIMIELYIYIDYIEFYRYACRFTIRECRTPEIN